MLAPLLKPTPSRTEISAFIGICTLMTRGSARITQ